MKKISILALIIAFSFATAIASSPKAPVLKTRADSLNYALGLVYGSYAKTSPQLMNDTTKSKARTNYLKGVEEGLNKKSAKYPELVRLAESIGKSLSEQSKSNLMEMEGATVNFDLIKQGLINGMREFNEQMTSENAQTYLQAIMDKEQEKKMSEQYGENKKAGEQFLAENAKKPGILSTESGIQYKIVKEGKGPKPTATDVVKVHYHGTLIDGTKFDSSVERKEPAVFGVGQVIKGWTEILQLMPVGSKWTVYIPQELAYGVRGGGEVIKPFSTLIFDIELISIEKAPEAAPQK